MHRLIAFSIPLFRVYVSVSSLFLSIPASASYPWAPVSVSTSLLGLCLRLPLELYTDSSKDILHLCRFSFCIQKQFAAYLIEFLNTLKFFYPKRLMLPVALENGAVL